MDDPQTRRHGVEVLHFGVLHEHWKRREALICPVEDGHIRRSRSDKARSSRDCLFLFLPPFCRFRHRGGGGGREKECPLHSMTTKNDSRHLECHKCDRPVLTKQVLLIDPAPPPPDCYSWPNVNDVSPRAQFNHSS